MRAAVSAPVVRILDHDAALDRAATAITDAVAERPDAVIGFATGSSVEPVYERLIPHRARFAQARAFALDEYLGLPPAHPGSYLSTLRRIVGVPLGIDGARLAVPDAVAPDPLAAATEYETRIRDAGGVDVQLLGIGSNGHIGFNEPGTPWSSRTHVVDLAPSTRRDNQRFFPDRAVPERAITQGIATILDARRIVLLAFGRAKAKAVQAMLEAPRDTSVPASAVWWHDDVEILLDADAASLLS